MGINSMGDDFDADTGAEHQAEGRYKQALGKAKAKWADLTDDETKQFEGNMEALGGYIQEKYGVAKEEVEETFGINRDERRAA